MKNPSIATVVLCLFFHISSAFTSDFSIDNLYDACDEMRVDFKRVIQEKQWSFDSDDFKQWFNEQYIAQFIENITNGIENKHNKSNLDFTCKSVELLPENTLLSDLMQKYQNEECDFECVEISTSRMMNGQYALTILFESQSNGEYVGDVDCLSYAMNIVFK